MPFSSRIRSLKETLREETSFNSRAVDLPLELLDSQVERIISLRNVGKYSLKCTASNPQTLESSANRREKLKTGNFERDLHEIGCYVVDWIHLAQDLVQWCSVKMCFLR